MRTYKQLTQRDRVMISHLKAKNFSLSEIAKRVGKNKSTISRELKRNGQKSTAEDAIFWHSVLHLCSYEEAIAYFIEQRIDISKDRYDWNASDAQRTRDVRMRMANQIRRRKKPETVKWVRSKIKAGWSPEQIAGRSKREAPERLSHECIYQIILLDRKKGGDLFRSLKRFGKRKERLGKREYSSVADQLKRRIDERPSVVEARRRLGDLEADLVSGYKADGYVLTVVDRRSRYVVLRKLRRKDAPSVLRELQFAIKQMKQAHTLTLDNGKEFAMFKELSKATGVEVYFAHPYCSTERGSVENMNGLLRYYLPKGSSFKHVQQPKLDKIQRLLNDRPRKCLKFLTPSEVHFRDRS